MSDYQSEDDGLAVILPFRPRLKETKLPSPEETLRKAYRELETLPPYAISPTSDLRSWFDLMVILEPMVEAEKFTGRYAYHAVCEVVREVKSALAELHAAGYLTPDGGGEGGKSA